VISGNDLFGIDMFSINAFANQIKFNRIGVDVTGLIAVPNGDGGISIGATTIPNDGDGIDMSGGTGNIIGGLTIGDRNAISGNHEDGVPITGSSTANIVEGTVIGLDGLGLTAIGK
jgi:hypothetical protein